MAKKKRGVRGGGFVWIISWVYLFIYFLLLFQGKRERAATSCREQTCGCHWANAAKG